MHKRSLVGVEHDVGSEQKGKEPSIRVIPCATRVEAVLRA